MSLQAGVAVLLNTSSGPSRTGLALAEVEAAFTAVGLKAEIVTMGSGVEVRAFVAERVRMGFGCVVAAGGDGTVRIAGAALAGSDTALGVIPAGTFNHFARDMHLPVELLAAVQVIAEGNTTRIDVGDVNGHAFLNNSSLGFYPTLVMERERSMQRGVSKTLSLAPAALRAMWRFPNTTVRLLTEETGFVTRTPFVFVGNNRYQFSGLQAGSRQTLGGGVLHLCAVAGTGRITLLKSVALALAGRIDSAPAVIDMDVRWTRIETMRRLVTVALDGEVTRIRSPLVYTIRPGALKVLVPARSGGAS